MQTVSGNKNWPGEGGAFSSDFIINLSPQCRVFSRALNRRLKAPLFDGPVRGGTKNDWCIMMETNTTLKHGYSNIDPAITKTRLYNVDALKSHFYIIKLGFTGIYITFFIISVQKHRSLLEPPRRGGSNEYPQSMF